MGQDQKGYGAEPLSTAQGGRLYSLQRLFVKQAVVAGTPEQLLPAAPAGKFHRIIGACITCSDEAVEVLLENADADLLISVYRGGIVLPRNPDGWFDITPDSGLFVDTSGNATVSALINYVTLLPKQAAGPAYY